MKILLINPPNENEIIGNDLDTTRKFSGFFPPLGLMYIGSAIKNKSDHTVRLMDCQAQHIDYNGLRNHLRDHKYDVFGITCLTLCLVDVDKTIKLIKEIQPDSKIICGGPHATIFPKETLGLGSDCVVVGEGENVITDALSFQNKVCRSIEKIEDLDSIHYPERNNVDLYYSVLSSRITNSMITTRGCPYQCRFCDRPAMGRKYRERSAANIVDEIEECLALGVEEINMYDDTFTINRERVMDICDEIEKRGLRFIWDIRARVNTVDHEMLKRLHKCGCIRIRMGVESGVQRVLDILDKRITLDQVRSAFRDAKRAGMETFAYFMIGNPTETTDDIETSYRFSKEIHSDYSQFTILCPFPSTKIYDDWLEFHPDDVWRNFSVNPKTDFIPPFWDKTLKIEELRKILRKIYRSYYFNPAFIVKKLSEIRNLNNARLLFNAAFDLVKH